LIIAIIQCFPGFIYLFFKLIETTKVVSTLNPATSILPLIFVVFVTMVKEAVEDLRRFQSDNKENGKKVQRLYDNEYSFVKWEDLLVGDIIKISCDEAIPADIVVLYSPIEMGILNIETTNLDGETSLKTRQALQYRRVFDLIDNPSSFSAFVTLDKPNPNLYVFNGSMSILNEQDISIDNKNVVLLSCSLRNTSFENLLNVFVFIAFVSQIIFCLLCTSSFNVFTQRTRDHNYLLADNIALLTRTALTFPTFVILYQVHTHNLYT
jgi:magnesium-transporting ATPase (P-type)